MANPTIAVIVASLRANPRWVVVLDALEAEARAEEREACAHLMEREGLPTMAWLLRQDRGAT